mmetsp:Transcript_19846/g.59291  ORF Transcript_19846/g.59291 Transcript_19846/m.59291 type:complete len:491 (+) Transcript_19846:159-1631(+)|eukprot:CAMPEP_0206292668 /NCGR_PEP_ID=MMETSP0106_2-20121207/3747_1 /ASSEMBLY_ACC=CAM_ASM_000206 /TAXON_ID=81532 /ORGANISM="Acanthoeca-like sp., Strain 10tr" /LENGTH=490 /DNA_ID=CAMNT_0053723253 /DNA_START=62 /DNA_END=1534 /DNA_ORIENTATION=-
MDARVGEAGAWKGQQNHPPRVATATKQAVPPTLRTWALVMACGLVIGIGMGLGVALYATTSPTVHRGGSRSATTYRQLAEVRLWGVGVATTLSPEERRSQRVRVGNAVVAVTKPVLEAAPPPIDGPSESEGGPLPEAKPPVLAGGGPETSASDPVRGARKDTCPGLTNINIKADAADERRLNLVLLATYPRSGNSWARTLFRTATQIKSDLTTVRGTSLLEEAGRLSQCAECETKEYDRMYKKLRLSWVSNVKKARPLYGIKGTVAEGMSCSHLFTEHASNEDKPWPYFPEHPPIVVKSHYPQIGDSAVETFTVQHVNRVIHIVRNPFDNIASRFLGNQRQHEERFAALIEARKRNQTTPAFKTFLDRELDRIAQFHNYWFERRLSDAERGVPTLYIRYEALCRDTPAVLRRMLAFAGYRELPESLACTLKEFQCHSANSSIPIHLDLFTDGQMRKIRTVHEQILDAYGYVWQDDAKRLALEDRPVLCEW